MPTYRLALKNGRTIEIDAESVVDNPDRDEIYFYYDAEVKESCATVKRASLSDLTAGGRKVLRPRLHLVRKPSPLHR